MIHYLKTWVGLFDLVQRGVKPFEVRRDDRGFEVGDTLVLQEYDPDTDAYTGREVRVAVTYILHGGQWGIEEGHVVLGTPHCAAQARIADLETQSVGWAESTHQSMRELAGFKAERDEAIIKLAVAEARIADLEWALK